MQKNVFTGSCIFFILTFLIVSCNEMWGDHSLGNNFNLLEGDRTEDRLIVYCTGKSAGACKGGIPVIPTYARHYDDKGRYAEYVETAKSSGNWILAKSIQIKNKKENYWIISKNFDIENLNCDKINCDSIIQSHVTGPLSIIDFQKKIKELNMSISLK